jgi:hypothetical protein
MVLDVSMDQQRNRTSSPSSATKAPCSTEGSLSTRNASPRSTCASTGRVPAHRRRGRLSLRRPAQDAPMERRSPGRWSSPRQVAAASSCRCTCSPSPPAARCAATSRTSAPGNTKGFRPRSWTPSWKPDFGPVAFPPDKGATIIGARLPIVNVKAYLTSPHVETAEWIANVLSSPATGLNGVHFYPGLDRTRGVALLNITVGNFRSTPLYRILEATKTELRRFGAGRPAPAPSRGPGRNGCRDCRSRRPCARDCG